MAEHAHAHRVRLLAVVLGLNAALLVVEAVGGVVFGSLALLADAAHMLSDVGGLAIALVAERLVARPTSARHSFGLQRAEVLGAQANAIILVATAGWIIVEAVGRLDDPPQVEGGGMLAVATAGLLVNIGSAVFLHREAASNMNLRGAFLHMVADAAGSVAAIVAALAVLLAGANWVDPAVSLLVAALVLVPAFRLLTAAVHVLLEGAPPGIDTDAVVAAIEAEPGVAGVHHVHLWSLASDVPALSAHVVVDGEVSLHEAQAKGDAVRRRLADRFGIAHATLELECHDCDVAQGHG